MIAPGVIACGGDGAISQRSDKNDLRSGETRAEAREPSAAGAKPMGEPLVEPREPPTAVAPAVDTTAPGEMAPPDADDAAPAAEAREETATSSERELPRGTVSIVGEAYPLPETHEASEEPCVCPVASPGISTVEELRALRAEARYRQPQGSAVRVAGGPPEGFERPPPAAGDHGPAIPGGFERPPVSTDDLGPSGSPAPERSGAW